MEEEQPELNGLKTPNAVLLGKERQHARLLEWVPRGAAGKDAGEGYFWVPYFIAMV